MLLVVIWMSIVTDVVRDLGIIGSHVPKISELKLVFHRAVPLNMRVGRAKAWASPKAAEQFQRNQMTSRALSESMSRFPLAR